MSLICFASLKGAPGVTAAALAVAAAWSPTRRSGRSGSPAGAGTGGRRKVLIEADASGGVLATRYRLAGDAGLVSLAAAGRSGFEPESIWRHTQELPGGLSVVAAPPVPAQTVAALDAAASGLGRHLGARSDVDALVDIGRLFPGSPGLALAVQASALLILTRPRPEDLQPAAAQLRALRTLPGHVGWVLVGDKPYGPAEVEQAFGYPVVSVLADDRRSVENFERGTDPQKLRRQPYFRSTSALANSLANWLSVSSSSGSAQPPSSPGSMRATAAALDPAPVSPPPPGGGPTPILGSEAHSYFPPPPGSAALGSIAGEIAS